MRDNHRRLPEIISVEARDLNYFGVVAVTLCSETRCIEFGLAFDAYRSLKRVLQMRPFDAKPGIPYRYFFVPSFCRIPNSDTVEVQFHIEQATTAKQFPAEIPLSLAQNREWFRALSDFGTASHLRFVS